MSFGWTAATWIAIGATAVTAVQQNEAQRISKNQAKDSRNAAAKNQQMQDEANNRANAKSPDSAAAMAANAMAGKGGQSGTMLTGPSGVDPSSLTLGKN